MRKCIACLLCLFFVVPVFSQTASTISEILEKDAASYLDFSYLIVAEAGMDSTPFEAYTWCERFGTFPLSDTPDSPITAKTVSHFLMKNYELGGGLMWSATQSPRYAWKEMKANGFWRKSFDPDRQLSGRETVQAVSKFFDENPDVVLREPPAAAASHDNRALLLQDKEEE